MDNEFYKKYRLGPSRALLGNETGRIIDLSEAVRRHDDRKEKNTLFSKEYENAGLDILKQDLTNTMDYQDKRRYFELSDRLNGASQINMELFDTIIRGKKEILSLYAPLAELTYLRLRSRVVLKIGGSMQQFSGAER